MNLSRPRLRYILAPQKTSVLAFLWLAATSPLACDFNYSEIEMAARQWQAYEGQKFAKMRELAGNNPSYAIAYRLGVEAEKERETALAYAYLTRAGYRTLPLDLQVRTAELAMLAWRRMASKGRSPLYHEAALKLARLAYAQNEYHPMLWFLEAGDVPDGAPLAASYRRLKGLALMSTDRAKAYRFYEKEAYKYNDPEMLLVLAEAYYNDRRDDEALKAYFAVLEHPWLDYTYLQAARRILTVYKNTEFTPAQKVRLAEGYRLMKEYEPAEALYQEVAVEQLSHEMKFFYYQNYARLLIDLKRYGAAAGLVQSGLPGLNTQAQEKLLADISERYIKPDRYKEILEIVPPKSIHRIAALNRIKALYKENHTNRFEEALDYLNRHDRDSYYAEKTAFSQCLEYLLAVQEGQAELCLLKLIEATKEGRHSGHARYHLGKLYSVQGKTEAALRMYRSVYLNSPDDYFLERAFQAAKNPEPEPLPQQASQAQLREWLSANAGHENALREFLQRKRTDETFAVDEVWLKLEEELTALPQTLNLTEKTGALLYALGLKSDALAYFKNTKPTVTSLALYRIGELTNNTGVKYYYLKQYLKEKNIPLDIFFMNRRALETLYPIPWFKEVRAAAKQFGVEEARLYALMKQESQFNPRAHSYADARGLMQVMPATAKMLNRRLKIKHLDLFNPQHSILLGAKFYADMTQNYSTVFEKIAVAYNAGPGRLVTWSRTLSEDLDYFIEQIPIQQTHHYVKATRAEYDRYRWLLRHYYDTNLPDGK